MRTGDSPETSLFPQPLIALSPQLSVRGLTPAGSPVVVQKKCPAVLRRAAIVTWPCQSATRWPAYSLFDNRRSGHRQVKLGGERLSVDLKIDGPFDLDARARLNNV